jgi:hypothetical protein
MSNTYEFVIPAVFEESARDSRFWKKSCTDSAISGAPSPG